MVDSLEAYLGEIETSEHLALATLLDCRYKKLGFREEETAKNVIDKILDQLRETESNEVPSPPVSEVAVAPTTSSSTLWDDFDESVQASVSEQPVSHTDNLKEEMERYLRAPNEKRKSNPIEWWNSENGKSFPKIRPLALKMLCIVGSSVPSERVYSSSGFIINAKRSRLSDSNPANLIFLRENLRT